MFKWCVTIGYLACLLLQSKVSGTFNCFKAIGGYRDCTCGVQYRDQEERCCNSETCLLPTVITENFTCPFQCQNGGVFDPLLNYCKCTANNYGLCCERATPICGSVLFHESGSINTPMPVYANNATDGLSTRCVWKILTDATRRIALGIRNASLELGDKNYLVVRDGNSSRAAVLSSYSSDDSGEFQTVVSTSRFMYIELQSAGANESFLSHLFYITFIRSSICGPKSFYNRPRGTIMSPRHPMRYLPNENCTWNITLLPYRDLLITFETIDIPSSPNCEDDGLHLAISSGGKLGQIRSFCGNSAGTPYVVTGASSVILRFTSNGDSEGTGFILHYQMVQ